MTNEEKINRLSDILKIIFNKELAWDGKSSRTNHTPEDVFNRWFNTTKYVTKTDEALIEAMELRIKQAIGFEKEIRYED